MGSIGVGDPAGDQEHLNDFDIPETLLDAVDSLRPLERHVIKRTFMEGAELPEIASEIGRTSCRVAQIRDKALAKLRRNAAVMEMAPTG
jgi:RNA polymerase sigma factor (sigma-70 family)